jgi:hypothetical protein
VEKTVTHDQPQPKVQLFYTRPLDLHADQLAAAVPTEGSPVLMLDASDEHDEDRWYPITAVQGCNIEHPLPGYEDEDLPKLDPEYDGCVVVTSEALGTESAHYPPDVVVTVRIPAVIDLGEVDA